MTESDSGMPEHSLEAWDDDEDAAAWTPWTE